MKLHQLLFLSVTAFSLATNSLAQNLENKSEDPFRHYEVEILLYKNLKVPKSKEYILPVSPPIKDSKTLDLSTPSGIKVARQMQYHVVPKANLQLMDIAENIATSPQYELLLHTGWRQPGLEKSQALPIWIKVDRRFSNHLMSMDDKIELTETTQMTTEETPTALDNITVAQAPSPTETSEWYEVEGKITVSLARYLHVYTDLVLRKPRRSIDSQLKITDSDAVLHENLADTKTLDNHRLKEHRRMRSKTLHYLDNPAFSMLIFITPYEATAL